VFFRLRTAEEIVSLVVLLVAHGCPIQAIVAAFKFDERTVTDWLERAGVQCRAVHEVVVGCPQALGQVQMDELRVKIQGKIVWMAMAMAVQTRLWLGGAVSLHRDGVLIERLVEQVKRCASALAGPILFCTDGFAAYVGVIRDVFRESVVSGKRGRPEKHPWPGILIAQVVKRYERGRLAGVVRRVVQGTAEQVEAVRRASQGDGVINTAFIERLNATFRSGLAALVRRTRALARKPETLERGMFLVGVVYNLCTDHDSLRLPGLVGGRKHLPQTPAMAAGLTDHRWSIHELLSFRVPVPHWSPPKRRGRVSNAVKAQIQKWK
jgi:IS1 family transposase